MQKNNDRHMICSTFCLVMIMACQVSFTQVVLAQQIQPSRTVSINQNIPSMAPVIAHPSVATRANTVYSEPRFYQHYPYASPYANQQVIVHMPQVAINYYPSSQTYYQQSEEVVLPAGGVYRKNVQYLPRYSVSPTPAVIYQDSIPHQPKRGVIIQGSFRLD